LKPPPRVRHMVIEGKLSEGHARALLGAPDPRTMEILADKVVRGGLSVRATEALVRSARQAPKDDGKGKEVKSAAVRDLESRLARRFGTRVEVRDKQGKGELVLSYGSLDELDRILALLLP